MFKKTVSYVDYNGIERTEDFYFNLSKAELIEMELGTGGGLTEYLERIINAKDSAQLIKIFKDLVLKSYGVKSEDGKRFIKSEEVKTAFAENEAYSIIFMELVMDDKAAAEFSNGIIPQDIDKEALAEAQEKIKSKIPQNVTRLPE